MDQDRRHLSFGTYLRCARREKGIALEAVAAATRIGIQTLRWIEAEDHDHLPAETFVRGFLRAYARQIQLDGDDVVARYLASRKAKSVLENGRAPMVDRPSRFFWPRLALALSGLAAIIAVSLVVTLPPGRKPPDPAGEAPVAAQPELRPDPGTAAPASKSGSVTAPAEGHRLHVQALAPTRLKIIVDRRDAEQHDLKAGDRLDFEARSGFHLLIGDAAGLRLTLDGAPVAISGRPGQVVTLTLP